MEVARRRSSEVACEAAETNIRSFASGRSQKSGEKSRTEFRFGQLVRPLDSVGCYVPGGRFPLVSTLLMTVIPAQVAGVKNIRVVSPQPQTEVLGSSRHARRT